MVHVLLVNVVLTGRTGTEVVCCEMARGLRQRDHKVSIFVQQTGPAADQLLREGFHVTSDIESVTTPDVIQANQNYPLLEAVARFPQVPAIAICHDSTAWFNEPIDLTSIRRYLAVDLACRDRIVSRLPHLIERVGILHNAVDLERFRQRGLLPETPKRALIITKNAKGLDTLCSACEQRGIVVDIVGPAVGREVDDLPSRLRDYDLVFATARSALEAIAAGCAVIVVDGRGFAGLCTSRVVADWRDNNFGLRLLSRDISLDAISTEIDRFDPADARWVSDFIRKHASLELCLDRLEAIHRDVIEAGVTADSATLPHRLMQATRALDRVNASINAPLHALEQTLRAEFAGRLAAWQCEQNAGFDQRLREHDARLRFENEQRLATVTSEHKADFERLACEREAAFRAEFDAYRDWTAPRNIGRRILRKISRKVAPRSPG